MGAPAIIVENATEDSLHAKVTKVKLASWKKDVPLKYLAIADLHIGAMRGSHLLGPEKSLDRSRATQKEFLKICKKEKPDVVFILGDIYHFKNITSDESEVFHDFLTKLLKMTTVLLQPGNHDYIMYKKSNLQTLQQLYDAKLLDNFYIASEDSQLLELTNGSQTIRYLNHPCEVPLELAEVEWANVVGYHGDVYGSIFDNGYDPTTDATYDDTRIRLPYTKADLFLLGDIHKRQWVAPNAAYCASMHQTKFSEDQEKGYIQGTMTPGTKFEWTLDHKNLASAYPLITINVDTEDDWPKTWPKKCWIKLKYNSKLDLGSKRIPDNVVKYDRVGVTSFDGFESLGTDEDTVTAIFEDPYFGADTFVANNMDDLDIPAELIPLVVEELDNIRKSLK